MFGFGPLGATPLGAVPPTYEDLQPKIDSANWTGIETRLQSNPSAVERIEALVVELDAALDDAGLTNSEKAKAQALTKALVALVHSPEPEWKVIARLLVNLLDSKPVKAALNAAQIAALIGGALNLIGVL